MKRARSIVDNAQEFSKQYIESISNYLLNRAFMCGGGGTYARLIYFRFHNGTFLSISD